MFCTTALVTWTSLGYPSRVLYRDHRGRLDSMEQEGMDHRTWSSESHSPRVELYINMR